VACQVGQARRPADAHPSVRTLRHALGVRDVCQVDERLGTGEVLAHAYHEVRAASQRGGTNSGKLLVRVFAGRCATVRKLVYHQRDAGCGRDCGPSDWGLGYTNLCQLGVVITKGS